MLCKIYFHKKVKFIYEKPSAHDDGVMQCFYKCRKCGEEFYEYVAQFPEVRDNTSWEWKVVITILGALLVYFICQLNIV